MLANEKIVAKAKSGRKVKVEIIILTLVLAVIAFMANPNGPLGTFWRPPMDSMQPTSLQFPFFVILNIFEAIIFGLGVSFLIFGYPLVSAISDGSKALTRAAFVSIAWLLVSWWPHDSMHAHNGMNLGGLLRIEYIFHFTLMVAGIILAYFFLTIIRQKSANR
jgi:hypothetical protein